jgi:protein-disulfide isomerase
MRHVSWIVALVVGLLLGFAGGRSWQLSQPGQAANPSAPGPIALPAPGQQPPQRQAAARPSDDDTVYRVPIDGSAVKGPADALVTIVESSDYQCPFCKRVAPTLKQLDEAYPGKIRWVFKHNPLPMHPNAPGAAQAAEAARLQGGDAKFWAMSDELFEMQSLDEASIAAAAQKLGLDVAKFKSDVAAGAAKARIAKDQALVQSLGAGGTPSFFINGKKVVGARPLEDFKAIVDDELKNAEAMVKAGTPASQVYDTIQAKAVTAPPPPPAAPPGGEAAKPPPEAVVYKNPTLRPDDPIRGPADAALTIVLFSDFQCPFCSRVEPTLQALQQQYPGKVRVVWKNAPLPFHPNALPAALAAEAAREQGKFWQMHDKLFADQGALAPQIYEKYAKELGLDLKKFKDASGDKRTQARVQADQTLGNSLGVNGTPTMFLNCRMVVGALPMEMLKPIVDEELAKAAKLSKAGKGGYEKACAANLALAAAQPAPQAQPTPAAAPPPAAVVPMDALAIRTDDPVRGNPKAPVTLVLFSDFECPFCGRVEPSIAQVRQAYGDKVKIVWKHTPLPFHQHALPAAQAAEAAREQGKFWEMHDKLFANQQALSEDAYAQYAKELGLDVAKFEASRKSGRATARIQEDQATARKNGVDGTPTMFVNGEKIVGAVPFEMIKEVIDRKLAKK